jgi:Icc-related predicted phosphoesterase
LKAIIDRRPEAVFMGGDLLSGGSFYKKTPESDHESFVLDYLTPRFTKLKRQLGDDYPRIFVIFGNDDVRSEESSLLEGEHQGLWHYAHNRRLQLGSFDVYGYSFVPPTPFLLKDWERYDVGRYVDPGCVSPEEGYRSTEVRGNRVKFATIAEDLKELVGAAPLDRAIFLFHSPPHKTLLDRAALDGKVVDHVSVDVHVGSIAIRRFVESRQPLVTLHGHVHESPRLTGAWRDRIGKTEMYSAAHDGPQLAAVFFDPENPGEASRELL